MRWSFHFNYSLYGKMNGSKIHKISKVHQLQGGNKYQKTNNDRKKADKNHWKTDKKTCKISTKNEKDSPRLKFTLSLPILCQRSIFLTFALFYSIWMLWYVIKIETNVNRGDRILNVLSLFRFLWILSLVGASWVFRWILSAFFRTIFGLFSVICYLFSARSTYSCDAPHPHNGRNNMEHCKCEKLPTN